MTANPFPSLLKQKQLGQVWSWRGSISVWRRCPHKAVVQSTYGLCSLSWSEIAALFCSECFPWTREFWPKLHWRDFLVLGLVSTNQALEPRLSKKVLFCYFNTLSCCVIAWECWTLNASFSSLEKRDRAGQSIRAGMELSRCWVGAWGFSVYQYLLPLPFRFLFAMHST